MAQLAGGAEVTAMCSRIAKRWLVVGRHLATNVFTTKVALDVVEAIRFIHVNRGH